MSYDGTVGLGFAVAEVGIERVLSFEGFGVFKLLFHLFLFSRFGVGSSGVGFVVGVGASEGIVSDYAGDF